MKNHIISLAEARFAALRVRLISLAEVRFAALCASHLRLLAGGALANYLKLTALRPLGFSRTSPYRSKLLTALHEKSPALRAELQIVCGEREIRTPDTLLGYTRFPGVPLKPLEHLSNNPVSSETECKYTKNPLITTFPASVFQYMPQSCAIRAESECSEGNEARIGRSRCSGLPGGLSR